MRVFGNWLNNLLSIIELFQNILISFSKKKYLYRFIYLHLDSRYLCTVDKVLLKTYSYFQTAVLRILSFLSFLSDATEKNETIHFIADPISSHFLCSYCSICRTLRK